MQPSRAAIYARFNATTAPGSALRRTLPHHLRRTVAIFKHTGLYHGMVAHTASASHATNALQYLPAQISDSVTVRRTGSWPMPLLASSLPAITNNDSHASPQYHGVIV